VTLTLVAGTLAVARPLQLSAPAADAPEVAAMLFLTLLLWPLTRLRWRLGRSEAVVLLLVCALALFVIIDPLDIGALP
jgi:Ca2+/Na+ antiporter